ncbi:MAG: hypothetical protein R3F43_10540 [bacterium]
MLCCSLWAALASTAGTAHADGRALRRFALLAGANNGALTGSRCATPSTDARALADVLGQLGGVAPEDRLLVTEPDPAALEAAFTEMGRRLQAALAAGDRVELLFYYSGHSDESGLLLGGQRVGYATLRQRVDALPADVRIAIVDACASVPSPARKVASADRPSSWTRPPACAATPSSPRRRPMRRPRSPIASGAASSPTRCCRACAAPPTPPATAG